MLPTKKVKLLKAIFLLMPPKRNLLSVKNFAAVWRAFTKTKFYPNFQTVALNIDQLHWCIWTENSKQTLCLLGIITKAFYSSKRTVVLVQTIGILRPVINFQLLPIHLLLVTYESIDLYFSPFQKCPCLLATYVHHTITCSSLLLFSKSSYFVKTF